MDFNEIMDRFINEEYLLKNNKIVKEETLKEYLNSLSKDELLRLCLVKVFVYQDIDMVSKLKNANNKEIIKFIIDNLYDVLDSILSIIRYEFIEQFKIVVNSKIDKVYDLKFNYIFLDFLKNFSIAKVEYDEDNYNLKFFMPKEFRDIFNKLLKDKNILKDIKLSSSLYQFVEDVLGTYGIIDLDKLYDIVNLRCIKINKNEFEFLLYSKRFFEDFYIYSYKDKILICNLEFYEEKNAIDFYKNQSMDYKIYSKQEYKIIWDGNYVEKLQSYIRFINYLKKNFSFVSECLDDIKNMIVIDYIYSAQVSFDVADSNFRKNIIKYFDLDNFMIEYLLNMLKSIYNDYPKWRKRGNI